MSASSLAQRYQNIRKLLTVHKQQQVLRFWDELSPSSQAAFLTQLENLDLPALDSLIVSQVLSKPPKPAPKNITPAPFYLQKPRPDQTDFYQQALKAGKDAIKHGQVAVLTVAGGQGTRLGFDGPKGAFRVSPVKNKSFFQIFAESILANQRRYSANIRWYIMTSNTNHRQIRDFFRKHSFFGLDPAGVRFFVQGTLPAFDLQGKLLLEAKDSLAVSPNGHGGTLAALKDSGCLQELQTDGIKYFSYIQVDNPLVHVLDPLFIGLHIVSGSEVSSKTLPKIDDLERVGNFCLSDGRLIVIEYSDLSDALAHAHNPDGSRTFNAASIALHIFSVDFIDRLMAKKTQLPYHRAEKKVSYIAEDGLHIEPTEPNAVKLEMFIFDTLPLAKNPILFETDRTEEFSPVKNAVGPDSPLTCRRDITRRTARWLRLAGIDIPRNSQGEPAVTLETSPLFALDAEEFAAQAPKLKLLQPLKMGDKLYIE